jgi:Xaa-Pro aminopeptidase
MNVFAERRRQLLERLQGVLVIPAAQVAIRNNDVEHEYRQDSDFYYLTGFNEPEALLVLAPNHPEHKFVLFVRKRDPEREAYDGARAGVEGAKADFGADAAYLIGELDDKLHEYLKGQTRVYYRLGDNRGMDERLLGAVRYTRLRSVRNKQCWPTEIVDPATVLHEMRILKREDELVRMRRAAAITRDAHLGAMALAGPDRYEYEIEARIREIFRRSGAERIAYEPIVGSGPNATVLHYRQNSRQMREGELLLIDAGCEFDYYAADVTRTFPVSGTFSPVQRRLYEIVLEAQMAAIEAVKPGANLEVIHERAVEKIVRGLVGEGLLEGDEQKIIEDKSYKRFYMHGTSHWLGMDVHDVGIYYQGSSPRVFEPGIVFTIEPGIYISPKDDKVPEEYRGLGIRIEDDILVTSGGHENLTAEIPKTAAEVERACRG